MNEEYGVKVIKTEKSGEYKIGYESGETILKGIDFTLKDRTHQFIESNLNKPYIYVAYEELRRKILSYSKILLDARNDKELTENEIWNNILLKYDKHFGLEILNQDK